MRSSLTRTALTSEGHRLPDGSTGILIGSVRFSSDEEMEKVLGANDRNMPYLEAILGVDIYVKGNALSFDSPSEDAKNLFIKLIELSHERDVAIGEDDIFMEYSLLKDSVSRMGVDPWEESPSYAISFSGRTLRAKCDAQKRYIRSLNENQIVFAVGPSGTGKTFIAVSYALSEIMRGKKQKMVITRPVVEAGESLGFLPGDLSQKLGPYLKPLYDSMEYFLSPQQIKKLEESGAIEPSPLAYMRGRSINHAIMILDEAQNATVQQMKMFLTRLGEDSKAIITGDLTQADIPSSKSGLRHALSLLHDIDGLDVIEFRNSDVMRSRIVKRIVSLYEEEESDG